MPSATSFPRIQFAKEMSTESCRNASPTNSNLCKTTVRLVRLSSSAATLTADIDSLCSYVYYRQDNISHLPEEPCSKPCPMTAPSPVYLSQNITTDEGTGYIFHGNHGIVN